MKENLYHKLLWWGYKSNSTQKGSIYTHKVPSGLWCVTCYSQAIGLITSKKGPRQRVSSSWDPTLSNFLFQVLPDWLKHVSSNGSKFELVLQPFTWSQADRQKNKEPSVQLTWLFQSFSEFWTLSIRKKTVSEMGKWHVRHCSTAKKKYI